MKWLVIGATLLIFLARVGAQDDDRFYWSIFKNYSGYFVQKGKWENEEAFAYYNQAQVKNGWDQLYITSNPGRPDDQQLYSAGYLEGYITWNSIWDAWNNFMLTNFPDASPANLTVPTAITNWITQNIQWMTSQIGSLRTTDPYWNHLSFVLSHLQGLTDGYNAAAAKGQQLTEIEFFLLNAAGDLNDLKVVTGISPMSAIFGARSSALVKFYEDDLFVGHTTWSSYSDMLRIWKIYNIPLNAPQTVTQSVSFSSYPGRILSTDDFYITSTSLAIVQTTNGIYNAALFKQITPNCVLSWLRAVVANRISADGATWATTFSRYNSGTYNNQWLVIDYKKYIPGSHNLKHGLFWILEQIPGNITAQDATSLLQRQQYWPSYNVPYFQNIYTSSGFDIYAQKYGDFFAYQNNPRGQIFAAHQENIDSVAHMKFMMRYNNWQTDPLSQNNAGNSVSSRFDLIDTTSTNPFLHKFLFGGIDSKVTNFAGMKAFQAQGISGPTYYQQPVFQWSDYPNAPHNGCPPEYSFDWEIFENRNSF